jgi:hypothetical protein
LDAISRIAGAATGRTVVAEERFPGELETLRADNVRLRRLLKLSEEQARAADPDQATLSGAPELPVNMASEVSRQFPTKPLARPMFPITIPGGMKTVPGESSESRFR